MKVHHRRAGSAAGLATLAALGALTLLAGCAGSDDADTATVSPAGASSAATAPPASTAPASSTAPAASAAAGASTEGPAGYVSYADYTADRGRYDAGAVVLYFSAPWCPDCRRTDHNLTSDPGSIPSDLTVVKVDYDSAADLKRRYGVTIQHTFVQVNSSGTKLARWTGSYTADDIATHLV